MTIFAFVDYSLVHKEFLRYDLVFLDIHISQNATFMKHIPYFVSITKSAKIPVSILYYWVRKPLEDPPFSITSSLFRFIELIENKFIQQQLPNSSSEWSANLSPSSNKCFLGIVYWFPKILFVPLFLFLAPLVCRDLPTF